jgi:hypothetical protein
VLGVHRTRVDAVESAVDRAVEEVEANKQEESAR